MTDTQGQMRALDDVLLDLAKKWNSLDSMTQRYLATMAAGSRQQSRFIALMANSERLTKLLGEAYNSAGAGEKQYEKTLDSLESKLNNLHTAWTQFTTSLVNSELVKTGVELLTKLLNTVNALTDAFGPLSGTIKMAATSIGLWKVNTALLPKVTNSIKNILRDIKSGQSNTGTDEAQQAAAAEKNAKVYSTVYNSVKEKLLKLAQEKQEAQEITQAQILGAEKAKAEMTGKQLVEDSMTASDLDAEIMRATAEGKILGTWKAKTEEEALEKFKTMNLPNRIASAYAYGKAEGTSWYSGFSMVIKTLKASSLFAPLVATFSGLAIAAIVGVIAYYNDEVVKLKKKGEQYKKELEDLQNKKSEYDSEIVTLEGSENLNNYEKKRLEYLKEQTNELKEQEKIKKRQIFENDIDTQEAIGLSITTYGTERKR